MNRFLIPEQLLEMSSWGRAKQFAKLLLPIPPPYTDAIQALWSNGLDNLATGVTTATPRSMRAVETLTRSGKLLAPLYFAAQDLYPERMQAERNDSGGRAVLDALGPGLFAALALLVFLHRRLNKHCKPERGGQRAEEWERLSNECILNMELGYILGSNVRSIGPSIGILFGGIRFLCIAPFLVLSAAFYERYRGQGKARLDPAFEHAELGCDHSQIVALILKECGIAENVYEYACTVRRERLKLPPELHPAYACVQWLDEIRKGHVPPRVPEIRALIPLEQVHLESLKEQITRFHKTGSSFGWMLKSSRENMIDDDVPTDG